MRAERTGAQAGVDPDDVGVAPGDPQDAWAAATDEQRGVRSLHRLGQPVERTDAVVLAVEVERRLAEEPGDDGQRFLEPVDPHPGRVQRDPGGFVVGGHPARTQAENEAALGDDVEHGGHAVDEHRVPVVVPEHAGLQPQRRGARGRRGERDHRLEGVAVGEVVGGDDRRDPQLLEVAQRALPIGQGQRGRRHRRREAKGVHLSSACTRRRRR